MSPFIDSALDLEVLNLCLVLFDEVVRMEFCDDSIVSVSLPRVLLGLGLISLQSLLILVGI